MTTKVLTKRESRVARTSSPTPPSVPRGAGDRRISMRTHERHVRVLKINAAAWAVGSGLLTGLWVWREWEANGAFERVGFDGSSGDWNPILWALAVGIWGLIVGIMALRVYFERPLTKAHDLTTERIARIRFHIAAWAFGMVVLTPLWALIEWQDNGSFERWSDNSQPGDWQPWILYVGVIWALVIAILEAARYVRDVRRDPNRASHVA